MSLWRLLPRLRDETPRDDPFPPDARPAADDRPPSDRPNRQDALSLALSEMEGAAYEVYALHGLPTRPGHYERPPRARRWRFIAEQLTPQERFERTLERPRESGWRFARLEDLGERSDKPDLAAASNLLSLARRLREARDGPLIAEDLLTAMELGATWRANREIILAARAEHATSAPTRRPAKTGARTRTKRRPSTADADAASG